MSSVDQNVIFDHNYRTEPDSIIKYQYLIKVVVALLLSIWTDNK